jgi:hypothetical protein
MATEVKFGDWLGKGFDLYKQNMGVLILAQLVAGLISVVSVGILSGPMSAGMILLALHIVDGKGKPEVGQVFQGFSFFLPTFLFCLVWGAIMFAISFLLNLIVCVGSILSMVVIYGGTTLLLFALFLIVDRKMDFWPASMLSVQTVKAQFWPLLGFMVVAGLIGGIGAILCGVGIIITMPITGLMMAIAYREFFPATETAETVQTPPVV